MKISDSQLVKISEYLLDISKLLVGSIFVPVFLPGSSLGTFNIWLFIVGAFFALVSFFTALILLPPSHE